MSTDTIRFHSGSARTTNRYGVRRIGGEALPLKRPFGSVTAAYAWLDRSGYDVERYETYAL